MEAEVIDRVKLTADPIGLKGGINLYLYSDADPVNGVDPLGLYRAGEGGGLEGNFIFGGGVGSYDCCRGNDLVHVKYFKVCYGAGFNASIGAGRVSRKCDALKQGDSFLGPEVGGGVGFWGAEWGVNAGLSNPNNGLSGYGGGSGGWSPGLIGVKATVCYYKVFSVEKVGCCND